MLIGTYHRFNIKKKKTWRDPLSRNAIQELRWMEILGFLTTCYNYLLCHTKLLLFYLFIKFVMIIERTLNLICV